MINGNRCKEYHGDLSVDGLEAFLMGDYAFWGVDREGQMLLFKTFEDFDKYDKRLSYAMDKEGFVSLLTKKNIDEVYQEMLGLLNERRKPRTQPKKDFYGFYPE